MSYTRFLLYAILVSIMVTLPLSITSDPQVHRLTPPSEIRIALEVRPDPPVAVPKTPPKKTPPVPKKPKPKPKKPESIKPEPIQPPKPSKPIDTPPPQKDPPLPSQKITPPQPAPPATRPKNDVKADYFQKVFAHIASRKTYPKQAKRLRHQGDVTMLFWVDRSGRVIKQEIQTPSPYRSLNRAAERLLAPLVFEPPPTELDTPLQMSITLNYTLKGSK